MNDVFILRIIIGVIATALIVLVVNFFIKGIKNEVLDDNRSIEAEATIIEINEWLEGGFLVGSSSRFVIIAQYEHNNEILTFASRKLRSNKYVVGQTITVSFNPENYNDYRVHT
jgi:hypothetical protein